jgi:hypothetical protein
MAEKSMELMRVEGALEDAAYRLAGNKPLGMTFDDWKKHRETLFKAAREYARLAELVDT